MGFSCKINDTKMKVSQEFLAETIFLRDTGLDNVNNINSVIKVTPEVFRSPEFYVTGASTSILFTCSGFTECPNGYTLLSSGLCQKISVTGATAPSSPITIDQTTSSAAYIEQGAVIYEDITNKQWPLITSPQGPPQVSPAVEFYNTIIPLSGTANGVNYYGIVPTPLVGGQHLNVDVPLPGTWPPLATPGYGLAPRTYFNGAIRESVISGGTPTLYPGVGSEILPQQFLWGMPWSSGGTNSNNWFDTVGIWSSSAGFGEWRGFSQCVNINTTKTYYIAFASNNAGRISLNGELMVEMNIGDSNKLTLSYANIIPVTLSVGTHVFYLEGLDYSGTGGLAMDIYDTDYATLTGITSYNQLTGVTIFSTINKFGSIFDIGSVTTQSYTCPSGYLYSTCSGSTCIKIETTGSTTGCEIVPLNLTGCTTGSTNVYNLDYTPDFNVKFTLTGNTDYTGYTGSLCYKVFSDDRFVAQNPTKSFSNGTEIMTKCSSFSSLSSMTINQMFNEGSLIKTWKQYLIRPYYSFTTKVVSPGMGFNTWNSNLQLNGFQDGDLYFVTVVDPPTPLLSPPSGEAIPNYTFIQDNLLINGDAGQRGPEAINDTLNYFVLKAVPATDIMLFLNGVKLSNGYDYKLITKGFNVPPTVEFLFEIKRTDWITANYIVGSPSQFTSSDFSKWFVDTLKVENILVDTNPGYVTAVNSNTITNRLEFYTSKRLDPNNNVYMSINGVELVENQQYFKSLTQDNRIIFDNMAPIKIGDIISILAVSTTITSGCTNYGSLVIPEFTTRWTVPGTLEKNVTGKFIIQVFDKNDPYNNVLYEEVIPFIDGTSAYQSTISSLSLNFYYRFRVTFETKYTAYLDNEVTTCSYSEGCFDTKSGYINNTY